jgi:hypothetical protein
MIWLTPLVLHAIYHAQSNIEMKKEHTRERELKATENMCGAKKTGNLFQSTNPPTKL